MENRSLVFLAGGKMGDLYLKSILLQLILSENYGGLQEYSIPKPVFVACWRTEAWCFYLDGEQESGASIWMENRRSLVFLSEWRTGAWCFYLDGEQESGVSIWIENRSLVFLSGCRIGVWCFYLDGEHEPGVSGWTENRRKVLHFVWLLRMKIHHLCC